MNMYPQADPSKSAQDIWEDFSLSFTPAVREVVEFAKHIPGFSSLSQNDQVPLLKAGTFEVHSTAQHSTPPGIEPNNGLAESRAHTPRIETPIGRVKVT